MGAEFTFAFTRTAAFSEKILDRYELFFDVRMGLLVRRYTESETLLGKLPLQTDYEDYRDVGGIKQPFLIHWSMPGRT